MSMLHSFNLHYLYTCHIIYHIDLDWKRDYIVLCTVGFLHIYRLVRNKNFSGRVNYVIIVLNKPVHLSII